MSRLVGVLTVTHGCDCARCGARIEAGSIKGMYLALVLHLRFRCKAVSRAERPKLIKVLWQLWRWKPGAAGKRAAP